MFAVELSVRAQKFLEKQDLLIKERLLMGLKKLKENPMPSDSKFIGRFNNDKVFRIRIGDYRALYTIKFNENIVLIAKIDKRSRIYQ